MKAVRLEPGLLTIFRLFLGAQLVIILINLHVHSARGLLPGHVWFAVAFGVAGMLALSGYLSWPRLRIGIGRLYLPVALVFAVLFSLVMQNLFLNMPLSMSADSSAEGAWQAFLFLFVPLVLVSWQYGFKWVTIYCLFATLSDLALVSWSDPNYVIIQDTYHRLLLIRFASFMLAGYVISRIMQQLRNERQALQEANLKLGRFVTTLEQLSISRERNRVARELHDTLAHTLSGLAIQLEAVNTLWEGSPEEARGMLMRSLGATRDGLTETRRAIQSLRATPLEDLGLVQALRQFAEATGERTGFRLHLDLPEDVSGLPAEVEQCFYRIGQEAIENAAKHARAESLTVNLVQTLPVLRLEVADNGIGFNPSAAEPAHHFGLQGMRERAELIHASLDISSDTGKGTRVSLLWRGQGEHKGDA